MFKKTSICGNKEIVSCIESYYIIRVVCINIVSYKNKILMAVILLFEINK